MAINPNNLVIMFPLEEEREQWYANQILRLTSIFFGKRFFQHIMHDMRRPNVHWTYLSKQWLTCQYVSWHVTKMNAVFGGYCRHNEITKSQTEPEMIFR